jgi:DNA-binding transcriptional regulator YiaG
MQDASQERLSALVAASGLSISEFARTVVGRDVRTVRRWLNGETEIPDSAAEWLARVSVESNGKSVHITVAR